MTEQQVQSKITKYLTKQGAYVTNVITASSSGTPDLLVCLNGTYLAFEVKLPGLLHTLKPLQQAHIDLIHQSGGLAFVVTSVAEVESILQQYGLIPSTEPSI